MKLEELPEFGKFEKIELFFPNRDVRHSAHRGKMKVGYYIEKGINSEGEYIEVCNTLLNNCGILTPISPKKHLLKDMSRCEKQISECFAL